MNSGEISNDGMALGEDGVRRDEGVQSEADGGDGSHSPLGRYPDPFQEIKEGGSGRAEDKVNGRRAKTRRRIRTVL